MATVTRELVRDPVEIIFADGKRYATQRWVTRCEDIRDLGRFKHEGIEVHMLANFGWVHLGEPFPTEDSVPSPHYEPPRLRWWHRLLRTPTSSPGS